MALEVDVQPVATDGSCLTGRKGHQLSANAPPSGSLNHHRVENEGVRPGTEYTRLPRAEHRLDSFGAPE